MVLERLADRPGGGARGAADIQSLADLTNSFEVVRTMQIAPITRDAILRLVAATLVPIVPLALTMMSLEDLKTLAGVCSRESPRANARTPLPYVDESSRQCRGTCVLLLDQGPMVRLPFLMVHLHKIQIEGTSNTRILDSVCSS